MRANGLPGLPEPSSTRWKPLRLGLVDLYHYDCEEFHFEDGHLLLRGNNGTGKSKVLSLTLPFLLDGSLAPARVEPDGDRGKRMDWNLLGSQYDRRTGYTWIEFGRREGAASEYFTLGCGLAAVRGRPRVESWHFITTQRVGQDLWLVSPDRVVLARERLRDALGGHGQLFETVAAYRRAVDERLFGLGEARYAALIDTLIQLRQPQLSKRPDEAALSQALTQALPPLAQQMLEDVAEAMTQLDAYRDELVQIEQLRDAVRQFGGRYRAYAQVQTRRQARELRQAETAFDNASRQLSEERRELEGAAATAALRGRAHTALDHAFRRDRAALDELRADPLMKDARRLNELAQAASAQQADAEAAAAATIAAKARMAAEAELRIEREQALAEAERARRKSGALYAEYARVAGLPDALRLLASDKRAPAAEPDAILRDGETAVAARRAHCDQLHKRLQACNREREVLLQRGAARDQAADTHEGAVQQHAAAETAFVRIRNDFQHKWSTFLTADQALRVAEPEAALSDLESWSETLVGENPAHAALLVAYQGASYAVAQENASLLTAETGLLSEESALAAERMELERGVERSPPVPHVRGAGARKGREGASLWRLVDFRPEVAGANRAGLEAALEASGLLDAWVTPQGALLHADTADAWLLPRVPQTRSLLDWLQIEADALVPRAHVEAVLAGISCSDAEDDGTAEAWLAPNGRFRLGPRQGAWSKTDSEYIGAASREAARHKRLAEITTRRAGIAEELAGLAVQCAALADRQSTLDRTLRAEPDDAALRNAAAALGQTAANRREGRQRLDQAQRSWEETERNLKQAQRELAADAEDLRLPADAESLTAVVRALEDVRLAVREWISALRLEVSATHEARAQQDRERQAQSDHEQRRSELAQREARLVETTARLAALREAKGQAISELERRMANLTHAVEAGEGAVEAAARARSEAEKSHARHEERVQSAAQRRDEAEAARSHAVERLRLFAGSGMFALAVPEVALPDPGDPWTVDPALTVARRAEQALADVRDDEPAWEAIQKQVSQDYTRLGEALTRLGQHAVAETTDFGLVVQVVYSNRPRRIDELERELDGEGAQRREILSARERELLENHLQAEIAASLQKLMREADARVVAINAELEKRPTSTGVRFKLDWQSLAEGEEGAPAGLGAARKRLLRQAAEAWSTDDRRLVGEFLQRRIEQERVRDAEGSRTEQLARALDYRHWHRFRVLRWQDGDWRRLSGPASSGERALGLTVPLFAAASSHYASARLPGPRLVLLDEAFAGIDDAARAHCMALIREFDLDFVMTSEREWGCYAELPGVAIAQLQRQPGVDAVHVSRWTWNGRERRPERDPTRRFREVVEP